MEIWKRWRGSNFGEISVGFESVIIISECVFVSHFGSLNLYWRRVNDPKECCGTGMFGIIVISEKLNY